MKKTKGVLLNLALIATIFTLSNTNVVAAESREVIPMGCTVGIQLKTDGVLVVGFVDSTGGEINSSKSTKGSEIAIGDLITEVKGKEVHSAIDLQTALEKYDSGNIPVKAVRNGKEVDLEIAPKMQNGMPVLGLWLRDGIEGIGTLTYYDPQTGKYGCLGHGIVDCNSGTEIPLGEGSIFNSSVENITKGQDGAPGELGGLFALEDKCGNIEKNTSSGIFGKLSDIKKGETKPLPVADKDEITTGEATILANIDGTEVSEYNVEITRIYRDKNALGELMLKINDEELLKKTGGIVRGMSGSPIIQNGKIIGAVTHVLVNDPTRGYGISIEKMLEESKQQTEENKKIA